MTNEAKEALRKIIDGNFTADDVDIVSKAVENGEIPDEYKADLRNVVDYYLKSGEQGEEATTGNEYNTEVETTTEPVEDDITFSDRWWIKNFGGDDIQTELAWLKKKHPDLEFKFDPKEKEIMYSRDRGNSWQYLDPKGFDWQDITDLTFDTAAGLLSLAGITLSGGTGSAILLGAAEGGLFDAVRRAIGSSVGLNKKSLGENLSGVLNTALLSGAGSFIIPKVVNFAGRSLGTALNLGKNIKNLGKKMYDWAFRDANMNVVNKLGVKTLGSRTPVSDVAIKEGVRAWTQAGAYEKLADIFSKAIQRKKDAIKYLDDFAKSSGLDNIIFDDKVVVRFFKKALKEHPKIKGDTKTAEAIYEVLKQNFGSENFLNKSPLLKSIFYKPVLSKNGAVKSIVRKTRQEGIEYVNKLLKNANKIPDDIEKWGLKDYYKHIGNLVSNNVDRKQGKLITHLVNRNRARGIKRDFLQAYEKYKSIDFSASDKLSSIGNLGKRISNDLKSTYKDLLEEKLKTVQNEMSKIEGAPNVFQRIQELNKKITSLADFNPVASGSAKGRGLTPTVEMQKIATGNPVGAAIYGLYDIGTAPFFNTNVGYGLYKIGRGLEGLQNTLLPGGIGKGIGKFGDILRERVFRSPYRQANPSLFLKYGREKVYDPNLWYKLLQTTPYGVAREMRGY